MSRAGDCYDNAVPESFFASLKKECIHRRHFAPPTEVYDAVADNIDNFYNLRRLHSSNDYFSPMHAELQLVQAMAACAALNSVPSCRSTPQRDGLSVIVVVTCTQVGYISCVIGDASKMASDDEDLLAMKQRLLDELGSETAFRFVNTRLILQCGVDLTRVEGSGVNHARARKVRTTLQGMGFLSDG